MSLDRKLALVVLALAAFCLVACEGPEGPQGPQGEQGDPGEDGQDYVAHTYLGDNADHCGHCHGATVQTWLETGHEEAYEALVSGGSDNNPYCLQCHTTGWDSPVSYGDSAITDFGPNLDGFDDAWASQDAERMAALEAVQCEACHGSMGPTIYDHEPAVSFATRSEGGQSLSLCADCHHALLELWEESGHAHAIDGPGSIEEFSAEFNRSSCAGCHTSEGFAKAHDEDLAAMPLPEVASLIGCVTCHDPHDAANEAQLRTTDDYSVLYDSNYPATFTGYGTAQVCVQCHHARRDVDNVDSQIADGYDHFGPHGSPQMDMFLGTGSYEIEGYDYESGRFGGDGHMHQSISGGCVSCHMVPTGEHEDPGHSFEPNVSACTGCHGGAADFDINGFQTEIQNKMDQLAALIGVDQEYWGDPDSTTAEQRAAAYAHVFVGNDGSHGVHNPDYAEALLDNAIASLQE